MRVSRIEEGDLAELLALQKISYRSEAEIYNDFVIPPLTQTLEGLREEAARSTILKVVRDGKIVGSVRAFEQDQTCFIGRLFVHPDCRDQGVGKRLMDEIEKCFAGCRYEIFTGHRSQKNLGLYERLGYRRFKTETATADLTFIYLEKRG